MAEVEADKAPLEAQLPTPPMEMEEEGKKSLTRSSRMITNLQMSVESAESRAMRNCLWYTLVNALDQSDMFILTGKHYCSLQSSVHKLIT